jgi:hypothetical protein
MITKHVGSLAAFFARLRTVFTPPFMEYPLTRLSAFGRPASVALLDVCSCKEVNWEHISSKRSTELGRRTPKTHSLHNPARTAAVKTKYCTSVKVSIALPKRSSTAWMRSTTSSARSSCDGCHGGLDNNERRLAAVGGALLSLPLETARRRLFAGLGLPRAPRSRCVRQENGGSGVGGAEEGNVRLQS